MTYGLASTETIGILTAAQMVHVLPTDGGEMQDVCIEVDIVCDGALDESFAIAPGSDVRYVCALLFESIVREHGDKISVEVDAYVRGEDYSEPFCDAGGHVRFSHSPAEAFQVVASYSVEV